jgi:acetylornithine/succinyldiaminopimelate/putrescine aminotransferase
MLFAPALSIERSDVDDLVDRFDSALTRLSAEAA